MRKEKLGVFYSDDLGRSWPHLWRLSWSSDDGWDPVVCAHIGRYSCRMKGFAGSLSLDSIRITQEGLENLHNNWIIGRCSALSACYCVQSYSSCEWMNESELKHLSVWPSLGYFFLSVLICLHTVGKQDHKSGPSLLLKRP